MRKFVFLLLLTISSSNVISAEMPSVKSYKENVETEKYDQFIQGLDNGLEWASDEAYRKNGIQIFCKPSDISLPLTEMKKMINDQLKKDESFYSKYEDAPLIGLALKNAYVQNFPCLNQ